MNSHRFCRHSLTLDHKKEIFQNCIRSKFHKHPLNTTFSYPRILRECPLRFKWTLTMDLQTVVDSAPTLKKPRRKHINKFKLEYRAYIPTLVELYGCDEDLDEELNSTT